MKMVYVKDNFEKEYKNAATADIHIASLLLVYLHTCILAYLHTCILAYMHICILAYMCILACFHTSILACLHTCIIAYLHSCILALGTSIYLTNLARYYYFKTFWLFLSLSHFPVLKELSLLKI